MMLMPSSDAASFDSELTHSERPRRRMNFGIYGAQDGKKLEDSGLEVLDEVASVLEKNPRVPILVDVCFGSETTDQAFWSSCVYYIKRKPV